MITLTSKVRPGSDVVDTELEDGKTALLHLSDKTYFSLNSTGSAIWRAAKSGHTLQQISENLQRTHDVDAANAERSVLDLVQELAEQQLVVLAD